MASEEGQASVELIAAIPAVLLAALISLQLLLAGYALALADGAAEAGALALAAGKPAGAAVRGALPGWADSDMEISVHGGEVSVRLSPPSPFAAVGDSLAVDSSATARPSGR
jgi:hypothetical protein